MRTKRLRLLATSIVVVTSAVLFQRAPAAQFEPERPRVSLTQVPTLVAELWPADFNEDGITDLVAERANTGVVVQIGVGDGTFGAPYVVAAGYAPVGVGDLNDDGFIDVLMVVTGTSAGYVLAGNGDGTFIGAGALGITLSAPTYVLDMNNDGMMDLLAADFPVSVTAGSSRNIIIYPGHGDFTFDAPTTVRSGDILVGAATADINGDGLLDIVANSTFGRRIDVFENLGNFTFAARAVPLDGNGAGVAARDLNGDGIVDLVAGMGLWDTKHWSTGLLYVLLGTGGGSFAPPVHYPVNIGPVLVVTGDFNGDGLVDIATGNQSAMERCEDRITALWDSISILPGRGDGTFGATASFALGDSELAPDTLYRSTLSRLNTSDLNADGRTDLLVSPGAIVLSMAAGPDTPPVATAGPDRVVRHDLNQHFLRGAATDADHDWLTFEWTDDLGRILRGDPPGLGGLPEQCFSPGSRPQTRVFTLTVRDGQGASSSDSMQWTNLGIDGGAPGPLPETFAATSFGNAIDGFAAAGPDGTFWLTGSGTDIWGTSDSFRFVHTSVSGNFDVTTLVRSVENVDPWTKAGLMVREKLTGDSRHASLFATPTSANGVAFQRREFEGATTVHTWGPSTAPPIWLRLVREGDVITASTRVNEGDAWSVVGSQTLQGLADPVYVGLAVTSHHASGFATAFFRNFVIDVGTPPVPTLPAGWQHGDVGSVSAAGAASFDGATFTVDGSGADIWSTQDGFHYVYTTLPGDGSATVRVHGVTGPHEWSKAGLMIRQSLGAAAPHHFLLQSVAQGSAYQPRYVDGDITHHTAVPPPAPAAPIWYRIERSGGIVRLFYSHESGTPTAWQPIGEEPFPPGEALIGFAVTSHADGLLARGQFDSANVVHGGTAPPDTWASDLIGGVGIAGSSQFDGTTHALSSSGVDIWGTADSFRFTYQTLAGDGSITARVTWLDGPHAWTKAGVMIRASLDPSAPHGFMFVSRDNGLAFQRRTAFGAATTHTGAGGGVAPQWVRLTRAGATLAAAASADGVHWSEVGSDVIDVGAGPVLVGLALTSHDNGALATATFENVTIAP